MSKRPDAEKEESSDPLIVLEIKLQGHQKNISAEELLKIVKDAYHHLAKKHHSDKNPGDDTKMVALNAAYDQVNAAAKLQQYLKSKRIRRRVKCK